MSQDADTIVADVKHRVEYSRINDETQARETRTGSVTVRIYVKRQTAAKSKLITVGDALKQNIGFFGANRLARGNQGAQPIVRYKLNVAAKESTTVYLKNFPKDMEQAGREGVEAWNASFGYKAFKVEIATAAQDQGDPRLNIVKWYDGLEEDVPWAGYAPTMADPSSGEVLATQILINGSCSRSNTTKLANYSKVAVKDFKSLSGKIGNVPFVQGQGETPIVSFFTNTETADNQEFVRNYYKGVIMHEFGHSLGLRHNFAASTKLDSNNIPSSVMDYEPNVVADKRTLPGSYDVAAIRFGYFGESPKETVVFCTDEDLQKRWDCNQGDIGDPINFTIASILNGVSFLQLSTIPLPEHVKKPTLGSMKNALKIIDLINQVPVARHTQTSADLKAALTAVRDAAPASSLVGSEKDIAAANLSTLKASFEEAISKVKGTPLAEEFGF